ncbi:MULTISPECIES: hypothetical protein [unclassified Helicobacter]|uniref:hypothetical protein n=1 Tax=unclassified Helicobacter TaxID=2593540 RepID=UPI0015F13CB3|nr:MULTISPECIES: hypothetical protein [unclassified Helicobacter]
MTPPKTNQQKKPQTSEEKKKAFAQGMKEKGENNAVAKIASLFSSKPLPTEKW